MAKRASGGAMPIPSPVEQPLGQLEYEISLFDEDEQSFLSES